VAPAGPFKLSMSNRNEIQLAKYQNVNYLIDLWTGSVFLCRLSCASKNLPPFSSLVFVHTERVSKYTQLSMQNSAKFLLILVVPLSLCMQIRKMTCRFLKTNCTVYGTLDTVKYMGTYCNDPDPQLKPHFNNTVHENARL